MSCGCPETSPVIRGPHKRLPRFPRWERATLSAPWPTLPPEYPICEPEACYDAASTLDYTNPEVVAYDYDPAIDTIEWGDAYQTRYTPQEVSAGRWLKTFVVTRRPLGMPSSSWHYRIYCQVVDAAPNAVGVNPVTIDPEGVLLLYDGAGLGTNWDPFHACVSARDGRAWVVLTEKDTTSGTTYPVHTFLLDCTNAALAANSQKPSILTDWYSWTGNSTPFTFGQDTTSALKVREGVSVIGMYQAFGMGGNASANHVGLWLYEDWDGDDPAFPVYYYSDWTSWTAPDTKDDEDFYQEWYGGPRFLAAEGDDTRVIRLTFWDADTSSSLAWRCTVESVDVPATWNAAATAVPHSNYRATTGFTPHTIELGTGTGFIPGHVSRENGRCGTDRYHAIKADIAVPDTTKGLYCLVLSDDYQTGRSEGKTTFDDIFELDDVNAELTYALPGAPGYVGCQALGCFRYLQAVFVQGTGPTKATGYDCEDPGDGITLATGPNATTYYVETSAYQDHLVILQYDPNAQAWTVIESLWAWLNPHNTRSCPGETPAPGEDQEWEGTTWTAWPAPLGNDYWLLDYAKWTEFSSAGRNQSAISPVRTRPAGI